MRKLPDIFFCLLVGISFLVTTAGFTVHHCLVEGSYHVKLISADPSCLAMHSHVRSFGQGSCEEMHDQNCCSTQVFSMDDPTLISHGTDVPELIQKLVDQEFFTVPAFGSGIETAGIPTVCLLHPLPLENSVYPGSHLVPLRL
ncbi:MAG TPA: hypothetical protein DDW70_09850 [Rikenellaceae bacterium]|nr:hypothetical protein [Bacteroidales bacterium]HBG54489.1 hypothetical protein [Rikenellaceae bacterium]